jgi:hypothetical protein
VESECIKRGKCGFKPESMTDQIKALADDWFARAVDEMNGAVKEKNARDGMNFYQHTARAAVLSDCRKQLMEIILPKDQAHSQKGRERGPDNTQD